MLPKVSQILLQKLIILLVVKKCFVNIVVIERVGVFFGQRQVYPTFPGRPSLSFTKNVQSCID